MSKSGQMKLRSEITAIVSLLLFVALVITIIVRSSLLKRQTINFDDPAPISTSLRASISDRYGNLLSLDSRINVTEDGSTSYAVRQRTYPYKIQSLFRLLGSTDRDGNGISGIEQLANAYLLPSDGKDKPLTDGVVLSLDASLLYNTDRALALIDTPVHIIVMDKTTGEAVVVWDNEREGISFDDPIYSLNDLSSSKLINAYYAAAMAEIDRTRIFDYRCRRNDKCSVSHGLITIDNLAKCQSAIDEMLTYYDKKEIDSFLQKLSFNDYSIRSFLDAEANATLMKSHPQMHILNGVSENGEYIPFELSSTSEPEISRRTSIYLEEQLKIASENERIIDVKERYAVYISADKSVIDDVEKIVRSIL